MARPLRVEYPDAIYHGMARGNGGQAIFHSDSDYRRMVEGLAKTVVRTEWQVLFYVWMPNHIHLFLKTPNPNLSQGMQYLLSGFANWFSQPSVPPFFKIFALDFLIRVSSVSIGGQSNRSRPGTGSFSRENRQDI